MMFNNGVTPLASVAPAGATTKTTNNAAITDTMIPSRTSLCIPATSQRLPSLSPPPLVRSSNSSTLVKQVKSSRTDDVDAQHAQERRIHLKHVQRRYTVFQFFYAMFGIVLMMVHIEYIWFANTTNFNGTCMVDTVTQCPRCLATIMANNGGNSVPVLPGRMVLSGLRVLISFSTAILMYYVYMYYAAECEVLKIKNVVPPRATILTSPLRNRYIMEMILFLIHPFPGMESIDPQWPNLLIISSLCMFTRMPLLLRIIHSRNSFNSSNGWFIGALTNVEFTETFFLKSLFKNHPGWCIFIAFTTILYVTSYSLFVVERFLCAFHADSCCVPMSLSDATWALVITILTIGYGDVVPRTQVGRFFAIIAGFSGILFTAVIIAIMSSCLALTRSEHKVNAFLKRDEYRRLINNNAARSIQAFIHLRGMQLRNFRDKRDQKLAIERAEAKLFDVLRKYRQAKRYVGSHDVNDPADKQLTMLEMMEVNVEFIRTKIEDLSQLYYSQGDKPKDERPRNGQDQDTTSVVGNPKHASGPILKKGSSRRLTSNSKPKVTKPLSSGREMDRRSISSMTSASASVRSARETASALLLEEDLDNPTILSATNLPQPQSMNRKSSIEAKSSQRMQAQQAPNAQLLTNAVDPSIPPVWAIQLEKTLQSLILQVSRVSNEVDSLQTRINHKIDHLHDRVSDLERKISHPDGFHEVPRQLSPHSLSVPGNESRGHEGVRDGRSSPHPGHSRGPSSPTLTSLISPHDSSSWSRSIDQFVTATDLEEFQ